jgi:integrase/recombinase XerD
MVISCLPWEIVMLENYYVRPVTIDRIRGSWIAPAIEQYVGWLAQQRFTSRSVLHRVPILVSFGEFAKAHGASELGHLPAHVEPFVEVRIRQRAGGKSSARRKKSGQEVRNPIRQMLRLAIPGYIGLVRPHKPDNPFEQQAPRFLTHLAEEKGLRPRSMLHYRYHLHQFATYLQRIGIDDLATLSPTVLSGFIAEYAPPRVAWTTARNACGTLRVLLR